MQTKLLMFRNGLCAIYILQERLDDAQRDYEQSLRLIREMETLFKKHGLYESKNGRRADVFSHLHVLSNLAWVLEEKNKNLVYACIYV